MAKKSKKATKAKKDKLPKTIAGVKIPKEIRKAGVKLAGHPVISDIVAAGLLAAAAALTETDAAGKAARAVGEAARKTSRAGNVVKAAAGAMGQAILDEIQGSAGRKTSGGGPKA